MEILRDKTGLGLGESISRFMLKLGAGDRVFVILSDKYLKSPYCMFELLEVWRNSRMDDEDVRRRIRVFRLPDARMSTPLERALCAKHWKEQFKELDAVVREHGADLLGQADFRRYKLMQDFAHRVGDMLALIADTLQPADFEELKAYGFADEAPAGTLQGDRRQEPAATKGLGAGGILVGGCCAPDPSDRSDPTGSPAQPAPTTDPTRCRRGLCPRPDRASSGFPSLYNHGEGYTPRGPAATSPARVGLRLPGES